MGISTTVPSTGEHHRIPRVVQIRKLYQAQYKGHKAGVISMAIAGLKSWKPVGWLVGWSEWLGISTWWSWREHCDKGIEFQKRIWKLHNLFPPTQGFLGGLQHVYVCCTSTPILNWRDDRMSRRRFNCLETTTFICQDGNAPFWGKCSSISKHLEKLQDDTAWCSEFRHDFFFLYLVVKLNLVMYECKRLRLIKKTPRSA